MSTFTNVTVLGAGNLGAQIAFRAAFYGFNVTSYDINDEALEAARGRFDQIAQNYVRDLDDVSVEQTDKAKENLHQTSSLEDAVKDADLVIEAIPEKLSLKQETYGKLKDFLKPDTIVVSNSSTLLPSQMAEFTGRPDKFMNFHLANNVHLINPVELMGHEGTSEQTYEKVRDFAPKMGLDPIEVKKEQPGYVVNSLLIPWLNAGLDLWVRGVADVPTIDKTAYKITNSRGEVFNPFRLLDLVGFGVAYALNSESDDPVKREVARRLKEDFMDKGHLGLETRHGFYLYDENGQPTGYSEEALKEYPEFNA